jgi:hypothetical protein
MTWRPDRTLKAILIYDALIMIMVWLPLVRGLFDGPSYQWGWSSTIGGRGLSGYYWLLVVATIYGVTLLYTGWRGARKPFHWLLLVWHVVGVLQAVSIANSGGFRFRGDTLGTDFSLGIVVLPLELTFFSLALFWIVRDLRSGRRSESPRWSKLNQRMLLTALSIVPVQFSLLRYGELTSIYDQVGVVLTLMQWVILNLALYPWDSQPGKSMSAS